MIGGIPNAAFGLVYYPAVLVVVALGDRVPALAAFAASVAAAVMSLVLAYSLLFVTRRSCPYCWVSHVVNWTLPFLLLRLAR